MMRNSLLLLAAMSLSTACKSSSTAQTETPGTDAPTDTTTDAGTTPDDGSGPQVRTSTSTTGSSTNKLGTGPRVKAASLVAKAAPADEGGKKTTKPPKVTKEPVVISGVFPTTAPVGSMIEIYGSNFDPNPRQHQVLIGGKRMRVDKAFEDRIVVKIGRPETGVIEVVKGKSVKGRDDSEWARTSSTFTAIPADGAFAQPRTNPSHGLLGTVYDLGQPSTELPAFADIGDPVGYIAVDDLDIKPGDYAGITVGDKTLAANFGVHFQGSLNITESGSYEFCLNAGDGAILYLDQQVIVDGDGAGDSRENCETLTVEPGEYGLDLLYYQNDGELGLTLSWAKDGGAKEPIPAVNFFPPDVTGLAASFEGN